MNIASIPFVHQLLREAAARFPSQLLFQALSRSIAPNMLWSPGFISMAIAVQYTHTPWFKIAPAGILLALTTFAIGLGLGRFELAGQPDPAPPAAASAAPAAPAVAGKRYLAKLLLQLLLLIGLIVAFQYWTGKSALVTVPVISFAGPLLLAVAFRRLSVYKDRLRDYFRTALPQMHNEIVLFSAIGFFSYALSISEARDVIPSAIQWLGFTSPLVLIPLIVFLTAFPCIFGVHPIIIISSIAVALPPGSIPLSDVQIAEALLLGYMVYAAMSPVSLVNLVTRNMMPDTTNFYTCLQLNWRFTLLTVLAATVILTFF
jgi:hypothetical protein